MKFYQFLCLFVKNSPLFSESLEKGLDKVVSRGEKNFSVHNQYMNFLRPRKTALDECLYKLSAGRSMVEMLGVLAIIGVLSVGAIAGYSKAMFKYKLNKQAEQLSTIINNALSYSGEFQDVDAVDMKEVMVKLNAVPKEMIIYEGSTLRFEDAMGNGVGVRFSGTHVSSPFYSVAVKLNSDIINDDRAISSCMNILNTVKAFSGELWQVFSGSYQIRKWGDKYCSKASGNCIRDMTLTEMDEMCRDCNGINCTFEITFL